MTAMVKLGSSRGEVSLDEFLTWSNNKQRQNVSPTRNPVSAERRARISACNKGKTAWNKGISHISEEGLRRISQGQKNRHADNRAGKYQRTDEVKEIHKVSSSVPVMTPHGMFPSKGDAADFYGIHRNNFSLRMKKHPEQYYALVERNSKGNATKGADRKGGRK